MKASLAIALAGTILLASPLAARADDANAPPTAQQPGSDDFAAKKDAYLHEMNQQMADWHQKLDAKGDQAAKDADKDVHQAWIKTQEASRRVAAATKSGWNKAQAAFERAQRKMKKEWQEHATQ